MEVKMALRYVRARDKAKIIKYEPTVTMIKLLQTQKPENGESFMEASSLK